MGTRILRSVVCLPLRLVMDVAFGDMAVDLPNLKRWAGVGWGTKEAEKLFCKRMFLVGGENKIW